MWMFNNKQKLILIFCVTFCDLFVFVLYLVPNVTCVYGLSILVCPFSFL